MNYDEFREEFNQQHPASVPIKPEDISSEYPWWLRSVVIFMFVCAALLSGVHTVPTAYAGIEQEHVAEWVRQLVALAAFVAIDLAIFIATYARLRGNRTVVTIMLIVVFAVALISNINSVLRALSAQGDVWITAVGVILGFGAPLIALLAGEMFVHMHLSQTKANTEAQEKYREDSKQWDATVLTAFRKYRKSIQDSKQVPAASNGSSNGIQGMEIIPSNSTLGHKKQPMAREMTIAFFQEHPELLVDGKPLEIAAHLGVGKSTVYNVIEELKRTNGHKEEEYSHLR